MEIQDYIAALEKVKEMNTQLGYALSTLLGAFKAELNKVKKMLKTIARITTQTTIRRVMS